MLEISNYFTFPVLQVHVNDKRRYPAYSNSDLRLTGTDLVIQLDIPEIKTVVIYTGTSLSIKLPYDLFSGNTEGQCGEFINAFGSIGWKSNREILQQQCCPMMYKPKNVVSITHLFFQEHVTTLSQTTAALQMANWKTAKTPQTIGKLLVHRVCPQWVSLPQKPL